MDAIPSGLQQLHDELAQKYVLHHLQSISFALAVHVNCLATDSDLDSNGRQAARYLLADRDLVSREFRGARDFNFFPLAFHPVYGNFSSARPPSFLDDRVLTVMRDNLSYLNDGIDPLTFGYFQAYSNIKCSIRHGPDDLLATKVGSPECDLLFMLVMTLASCSVTPAVLPNTKEFTASATRRDPGSFAASLTTRMLWFLQPSHFPWQENWPKILRVAEMTKKLEHKGVHNRLLRHIGWVKVVAGNRDSPRNADLQIEETEKLVRTRKTLLTLLRDPAGFVRFVFQSHDPIWLDRCSQIIRVDE